ncbi:hypothetical protein ACHAXS_006441 [Conticribra weissflogii]
MASNIHRQQSKQPSNHSDRIPPTLPTDCPTVTKPIDSKKWEDRSTKILDAIRCLVDALRSAPPSCLTSLNPLGARVISGNVMNRDRLVDRSGHERAISKHGEKQSSLLQHLIAEGILEKVHILQLGDAFTIHAHVHEEYSTPINPKDTEKLKSELIPPAKSNERRFIARRILLPLLHYLGECYAILDNLTTQQPPPSPESQESKGQKNENDSDTNACNREISAEIHERRSAKTKKKTRKSAPPPPGMLSLRDYTNVACLLEFTISICLIPRLEYPTSCFGVYWSKNDNIEHPIKHVEIKTLLAEKRCGVLPKSLSGRISKWVLSWGTVFFSSIEAGFYEGDLGYAKNDHENRSKSEIGQCPQLVTEFHQIFQTLDAYNELTLLATAMGHVLLLDRFRPMLLPRHLNDVFMTLLFLERLSWWMANKNGKTMSCNRFSKEEMIILEGQSIEETYMRSHLHNLEKSLLFAPLQISMPVIAPVEPTKQQTHQKTWPSLYTNLSSLRPVDHREAALAFRTLLSGGAVMGQEHHIGTSQTAATSSSSSNEFSISRTQTKMTIPPWLRMRLGQCLTELAREDLRSVVDVFVAYARGSAGGGTADDRHSNEVDDEMTGAAARLARALCAKPANSRGLNSGVVNVASGGYGRAFEMRLCRQFVDFLVDEGEVNWKNRKSDDNGDVGAIPRSRSTAAMFLTFWATISQLHLEVLKSIFLPMLTSGLTFFAFEREDHKNHRDVLTPIQSAAAIGAWLAATPSSIDSSTKKKVSSLLLEILGPSPKSHVTDCGCHPNVLGQIVRLTASCQAENNMASPSRRFVVEIDSVGEQEKIRKRLQMEVETTLLQIVLFLAKCDNGYEHVKRKNAEMISLELVKAVSTNDWDRKGYGISTSFCGQFDTKVDDGDDVDAAILIDRLQCRAKSVISAVVVPISTTLDAAFSDGTDKTVKTESAELLLPSALFNLALLFHFTSLAVRSNDHDKVSSQLQSMTNAYGTKKTSDEDKEGMILAASALLANLCESCSPVSLLGQNIECDNETENGILQMLALVIKSAGAHFGADHNPDNNMTGDSMDLLSTTSLTLSFLTALLELGSKKRPVADEELLQSTIPALATLSSLRRVNISSTASDLESSQLSRELAESAEMASHAMALIASRHVIDSSDDAPKPLKPTKSRLSSILDEISLAEQDLQSNQPPVRAKGVVSLRHIARSLANVKSSDENDSIPPISKENLNGGSFVTEISDTPGVVSLSMLKEELALITRTLARICLNSLADSESYVYLASIHTLVAVSDVCPSEMMPLMGAVVATGSVFMTLAAASESIVTAEVTLSQEQRIKATEALIFMIRRRGEGIFMHGPLLLDMMLFGPKKAHCSKKKDSSRHPQMIQSLTHSYFMGLDGHDSDNDDENEDRKIRLKTGGPVFDTEEDDLLRSATISVVCELIAALNPAVIATYCPILVQLAITALRLDSSRPVRRAAAFLSREIYACVEKETNESGSGNGNTSSSMAVALMSADEESLFNLLRLCLSADEVDYKSKDRCNRAVKGKVRLVDPATQSRCEEALKIRQDLDDSGILNAAKLAAISILGDANNPVVQVVRRALSQSSL